MLTYTVENNWFTPFVKNIVLQFLEREALITGRQNIRLSKFRFLPWIIESENLHPSFSFHRFAKKLISRCSSDTHTPSPSLQVNRLLFGACRGTFRSSLLSCQFCHHEKELSMKDRSMGSCNRSILDMS